MLLIVFVQTYIRHRMTILKLIRGDLRNDNELSVITLAYESLLSVFRSFFTNCPVLVSRFFKKIGTNVLGRLVVLFRVQVITYKCG